MRKIFEYVNGVNLDAKGFLLGDLSDKVCRQEPVWDQEKKREHYWDHRYI